MIDVFAWAEKVIRCRQPRGNLLGLTHEQQWRVAQFTVTNVALACRRLLGRVALRLPMKRIVRDEVILVHRGGRVLVFGLLQRHKEGIELTVLQMQDALALARPIVETPVAKRDQNLVTRVGSVDR